MGLNHSNFYNIKEVLMSLFATSTAGTVIALNFEIVKSVLLFFAAFILIIVQIWYHILKIRNEKKER
jgi:hypothetical protein